MGRYEYIGEMGEVLRLTDQESDKPSQYPKDTEKAEGVHELDSSILNPLTWPTTPLLEMAMPIHCLRHCRLLSCS